MRALSIRLDNSVIFPADNYITKHYKISRLTAIRPSPGSELVTNEFLDFCAHPNTQYTSMLQGLTTPNLGLHNNNKNDILFTSLQVHFHYIQI